jgi:hypothetical protein
MEVFKSTEFTNASEHYQNLNNKIEEVRAKVDKTHMIALENFLFNPHDVHHAIGNIMDVKISPPIHDKNSKKG